jgi:type IV pilus assembly protein PilC
MEAETPAALLGRLREQGLTPVSVEEIPQKKRPVRLKARRRPIRSSELAAVCWQLTTMLEGGVAITSAIETIGDDIENTRLREVLKEIQQMMEKGEAFSEGIRRFPKVFNRLCCAIITAGETGGNLPVALRRLAVYFDNRDKLARKVKAAVAYPAFVLAFVVLIVAFIMTFIIPRFRTVFQQFGGQLPAFTRIFMKVYEGISHNVVWFMAAAVLGIAACAVLYHRTEKAHYFFCRAALRLPLLGKIFSQAFVALFCKTMATLLSSGVSVLEAFEILASMTNNDVIKNAVTRTRDGIIQGSNISMSMAHSGFFPNMVVKMIQVGEQSGSLPGLLDRTSDYYERKVDSTISTVTSLLEPVMIVTVGGIVLVVVLALYLPIFSMSQVGG